MANEARARAHLPMNRTQARRLSRLNHRKQVERISEKAATVSLPYFEQAKGSDFFSDILSVRPGQWVPV